jgi:predicted nucleic acid-binding protein
MQAGRRHPSSHERLLPDSSRRTDSYGSLREYLAAPSLPMAMAIADVRHFQSLFEVAPDGGPVFEQLLKLLAAYPGSGKQVHDANLVATMLVSGVNRLLTYNARDFQRFTSTIKFEPLVPS